MNRRINESLKRKDESSIFHSEQVGLLHGDFKRVQKWSHETLVDSFEMRFACGTKGYNYLRSKKHYPLPSIRTQQLHLQHLHFDAGILHEVFELLQTKVECMSPTERDCGLVLDEMSIDKSLSFCNNNKKMFGKTTISGQEQKATHGLIVMLVGIKSRWKQIVAYHFTGNTMPNNFQKNLVIDVIRRAEEMGLKVHFVTTDCGPNNVRMWNDFGLKHSRDTASLLYTRFVQRIILKIFLMQRTFSNLAYKGG